MSVRSIGDRTPDLTKTVHAYLLLVSCMPAAAAGSEYTYFESEVG